MKCPFCNQEIDDLSTVCPICGKEVSPAVAGEVPAAEEVQAAETAVIVETPTAAGEQAVADETITAVDEASVAVIPAETKKSKKTLGIAAAIAAVGVIAVAAAVMMPKQNPKDIVVDAFKSITAEGQADPMEEIFGWKAMNEKLSKEASEMNLELQLQDSSDETVKSLTTGEFGMSVFNDPANKKASGAFGIGYADMNLANVMFYLDDKQMVMAIPELSTKAFSINYAEDLEGQLERSPFVGQMMADNGMDITGLNDYLAKCNELASTNKEYFNIKELWNRYKEGSKAIDDLKAAMTVEETEKKGFTIDGQNQDCKGYNVTITKDALVQFAGTTKEFLMADETLKKDFVEYMALMKDLQSTMSAMYVEDADKTPEELQEETWKTAGEQADLLIEQMKESMGDVSLVVYPRKDGKMASFDYSTTVTVNGELLDMYGTVTFGGGYNMMANVKADINMKDASGQIITLLADKTGTYEAGKTYAGQLTITGKASGLESAEGADQDFSLVCEGNYTVDGGAYTLTATVLSAGTELGRMTSTGMVQNLVKGESFELFMDSIKLESDVITGTGENEYVDISGFYKAGPLTSTIEIPAGENFDVLAATEEDYNTVYSEIMGQLIGIVMGMGSAQ